MKKQGNDDFTRDAGGAEPTWELWSPRRGKQNVYDIHLTFYRHPLRLWFRGWRLI